VQAVCWLEYGFGGQTCDSDSDSDSDRELVGMYCCRSQNTDLLRDESRQKKKRKAGDPMARKDTL